MALAAGIVGGFCSSAPIGPINLWVADRTLEGQEARLRWFLVGVIAVDIAYALLAGWGYTEFLQRGRLARILTIVGGGFLILLGLLALRQTKPRPLRAEDNRPPPEQERRPARSMALGAVMVGTNPAFVVFWIFAINITHTRLGVEPHVASMALFAIGILIGDLIWFSLLRYIVRRGKRRIGARGLRILRIGIACGFIVLGVIAVAKVGVSSV